MFTIKVPTTLDFELSYTAAYLNKIEEKLSFGKSTFKVKSCCQVLTNIVLRVLAAIGCLFFSLRDLKDWLCMTRTIIKFVGTEFYLTNLVSIVVFPIIALVTL